MNILLAIDESHCSRKAIQDLLRRRCPSTEANVKVVTVVDFFEALPALAGDKEKEIQAARELLKRVSIEIKNKLPGMRVSTEVLDGYTKELIVDEANTWPADLIIVGSHGRRGLSAFVLGSVSQALLHHSPCAVRIVRDINGGDTTGFNNVLVAVDDSKHSRFVVEHILESKWTEKIQFKLLNVIEPVVEQELLELARADYRKMIDEQQERLKEKAEKCLAEIEKRFAEIFGAQRVTSELLIGDPREKILETASDWPAGLIVMGSHGRNYIERLRLGSVSEAVSLHSPCSVEVVKLKK